MNNNKGEQANEKHISEDWNFNEGIAWRCGLRRDACLSVTMASADTLTIWSGYPEMAPFYQHVADGMKASHPEESM